MKEIFSSASKIVFILLGLTACIALITKMLEAKDFMILAISAFSYYFTRGKQQEVK